MKLYINLIGTYLPSEQSTTSDYPSPKLTESSNLRTHYFITAPRNEKKKKEKKHTHQPKNKNYTSTRRKALEARATN